jgi:hypothetical protein
LALLEEGVERFDLIEEQPVVDHALVVGGQLGQGSVVGHQAQSARDGGVVVDRCAFRALFREEDALVIGRRLSEQSFLCVRLTR